MLSDPIKNTIRTTLTVCAVAVGLLLLYQLRDIVILLFIAFIIASAFRPIVLRLDTFNAPKWVNILAVYVVFFCLIVLILGGLIPLVLEQVRIFIQGLPAILAEFTQLLPLQEIAGAIDLRAVVSDLFQSFSAELITTPSNVFNVIADAFSSLFTIFMVIMFSYYLLLEHDRIKNKFLVLLSKKDRDIAIDIINRAEEKLGAWLRGQVVVMLLIGLLTFIGLLILRVNFALPLAIIAGLLEIIPLFGPVVGMVPALIVAVTQSPWHALGVFVLYILVQQIGGVAITPKVMNKAVGVDPLIIILSIMVGGRLAGTAGVLLAIPVAAVLSILLEELHTRKT